MTLRGNEAAEKSLQGRLRGARAGRWVVGGTPPYGYAVDADSKKLVIRPEQAQVVEMAHQWLAEEGLSVRQVQQRLNGMGIPTSFDTRGTNRRQNPAGWWSNGQVHRILTRTVYIGYSDWKGIRIPCPRIISDELWEKGREQLSRRSGQLPKKYEPVYLLKGLIHCGVCGRLYSSALAPRGTYYRCPSQSKQNAPQHCGAPNLRGAVVDSLIWKMLTEYIQKPELLRDVREVRRIEALRRELAFLDEMADQGQQDAFPAQEIQERLSRRKREIAEELARTAGPTELEVFCEQVREGLDALDAKGRQELVRLLIDKIVVTRRTVEVHVVFPVGVEAKRTYLVT